MDTTMFDHIASSITVESLCSPLNPSVRESEKIEDLLTFEEDQSLDANPDNPWPVVNDDCDAVGDRPGSTLDMKPGVISRP